MNYRKLALLACAAASCVGCVTETKSIQVSPNDLAKMKNLKEVEVPKREAKPETWIAVGLVEDSKAADPRIAQVEQNAHRDEARKAFQKAIELDPKSAQAPIYLANSYLKQNDLERAIAVYQRALQQNPKSAELWFEQSKVHCNRQDLNSALQCLAKAHGLEPENHHYATQYGLCLARAGRPQEAMPVLCRVMNKADANYNVARMMAHLKQQDLSKQYLQAALVERPTHESALALLVQLSSPVPSGAVIQIEPAVRQASWNSPQ